MMNNNNQNNIYNQDNNINRRRQFPNDKPRAVNDNMNLKYGPIPNPNPKPNYNIINRNNNNNIKNMNQNRNSNFRTNESNELSQAFLIIQNELKKKNNRINELERKVRELTAKIRSLKNNNFTSNNSPMMTPYKEEPKNIYNNNINEDTDERFNNNLNNMGFKNQNSNIINLGQTNIRNNSQKRAFKASNLNYNSDNENIVKRNQNYDNLSHSNDNSVLTYNGVHSNSKKDVKEYLKEVKEKIEPKKFKEFIRNIKLLTSKSEIAPNKEIIIENMRKLFGNEHLDLFLRFEKIIGAGR